MAGLFSLGSRGGRGNNNNNNNSEEEQQQNPAATEIPPPETLFWYNKNDDVVSSYRGFELWNQQQQQQQQQFFPQPPQPSRSLLFQQDLYSSAAALGVGPSRVSDDVPSSRSGGFVASGSTASGSGSGGISCQDCGNQAKKDCPHVRCRTCCKSRGFDCQTHVKSTWVPAAKRRERQQQLTALKQQQQQQIHGDHTNVPENQRDHNHNHNQITSSSLACTRLSTNPSPSEEVNFPALVSTPAEFRCVRVSSVDESEEEYAYSTAVNIGGHVFRGILYDYGPDDGSNNSNYNMGGGGGGNSSNSVGGVEGGVQVQPLNLISGATAVGAQIVDPSSLYPAPLNTFMPPSGTQFFPHPRS